MRDYHDGAFDVALSGISITPERAASARFSVPYQSGGKTPIARCSERTKLATLAQIDDERVRVIVNPGGTNEAFVRAELKRASVRVFADNRAIFDELLAGRADVMITDDVEAELQHRRHPELCRTNKLTFTRADKAWLVQPDDQLVSTVDAWLKSRLRDRTVARLLSRALAQP
jgi:cyclohexadienyl dehydratase